MPERVIYLSVDLPQWDKIQEIRESYDPLAATVPPHITLVFPFESDIDTELLIDLIDRCVDDLEFEYIEFSLKPAILVSEFCFFPIDLGRDEITELHDMLYNDILEPYLSEEHEYIPHVTVGRTADEEEAAEIKELTDEIDLRQTGAIRSIVLERMHSDVRSTTEYERDLRPD